MWSHFVCCYLSIYYGAAVSQSLSDTSWTLLPHRGNKSNIRCSYFTGSLWNWGDMGMNRGARCINRMKWGSLQGGFPWKLKSTLGHRGISLTSLLLLSQNVWHLNLVDLGFENLFYTLTEHCKSGLTLMKCARLLSIHQSSEWVVTLSRKLPLPFNVIMVQLRSAYHLAKADCIS